MHVHAQAIGIDKSASQIAKANSRHQQHPNLTFHQVEAWDLNSVLKLTAAAGLRFSVVFIDVSGSRRVGDVDNLVMKYEQVRGDVLLLLLAVVVAPLLCDVRAAAAAAASVAGASSAQAAAFWQ
jgi:hypothetical protein